MDFGTHGTPWSTYVRFSSTLLVPTGALVGVAPAAAEEGAAEVVDDL